MIEDIDCMMARIYQREQELRKRMTDNWTPNRRTFQARKKPEPRQQKPMTDIVTRLRTTGDPWPQYADVLLCVEAADEIERLRVIEDAAISATTYFHMGDGGEEDFDEQRMVDLMAKLGRALEPPEP